VYITSDADKDYGDGSTTNVSSSKMSDRSTARGSNRVKGMSVLQTLPPRPFAIPPAMLEKSEVEKFRQVLNRHSIDTSQWGKAEGTKTVEHLFWEVNKQRGSILTGMSGTSGTLKRVTRLLKIRLIADIFGVEHVLVSRMQFMHDGRHVQRRQVPLKKLKWNISSQEDITPHDQTFYAEDCPHTDSWHSSCVNALQERLGLSERVLQTQFEQDVHMYSYHTEDNVKSSGYPGLNTLYCVHQVTFRVVDPDHPR
ncbi:unnamed protein product, partial [Polarella glacialis]